MKILVIGGSYFFGRVFIMQMRKTALAKAALDSEITVVNRGSYSMESFGVKQVTGDRHDAATWQQCGDDYDVIVDFCGYNRGDIELVLRNLRGTVKQYIFISTVDVCRRDNTGGKAVLLKEEAPYEDRPLTGDAGEYILGKVALEKELACSCADRNIAYTVIRPAFMYGPYNYAPRESVFIGSMVRDKRLYRITGCDGSFQCTYVADAAQAVIESLLNGKTYGKAYHICGSEHITYERFADALERAGKAEKIEFEVRSLPFYAAAAQGIELPFPVAASETVYYDNSRSIQDINMKYTAFEEGMLRTFKAFRTVYE